jgi:hypothetical protein
MKLEGTEVKWMDLMEWDGDLAGADKWLYRMPRLMLVRRNGCLKPEARRS